MFQRHKVNEYNFEYGFPRNAKIIKNILGEEEIKKLQSVNFIFDPLKGQFDTGFKYLQEYFEREVTQRFH